MVYKFLLLPFLVNKVVYIILWAGDRSRRAAASQGASVSPVTGAGWRRSVSSVWSDAGGCRAVRHRLPAVRRRRPRRRHSRGTGQYRSHWNTCGRRHRRIDVERLEPSTILLLTTALNLTTGITSYHELCLRYRYSTNSGERESRPFHEEPETSVSILISSTTVLHLDIFLLCIQHCRNVHSHWSSVFNLLKFDHTPKKERKECRGMPFPGPAIMHASTARTCLLENARSCVKSTRSVFPCPKELISRDITTDILALQLEHWNSIRFFKLRSVCFGC